MNLDVAAGLLGDARRLVVLSGAGVSTESGVPDFRSPGGIWSRFDPNDFSFDKFVDDPARFWQLRAKLMLALDLDNVRPNPAHEAIARASASPRFLGHVTQNIDGLFHEAGHADEKLVEIHGSARTVRCLDCLGFFPFEVAREQVERDELPPACPTCGGSLKPGTVLFGEQLPRDALARAAEWTRHTDCVLVVGSSLSVYPIAALPQEALDGGASLVIVNDGATSYDGMADAVVRGKAGKIVPDVLRRAGFD